MNDKQSTINNSLETVIGVEVHVETNTKTKMFCACQTDYFGAKPNIYTCPVCLGLPGALPFTNGDAIEKCIQIGLALGCTINRESLFERKNYFYPDLPKGYQISQYRWPLCVNGAVVVDGENGKKTIRINRVHQEEDTGKLTHVGNKTLIDFNRSGIPLVEIVTEADFRDSSEVRDYGKKLQQIIRSIGVSSADMEKGDMRLEANVSVRPKGQKELPKYRVELKNINSFKFIADAIDYEVKRQIELLDKGEAIHQQTRGYNEGKRETFLQRSKEEADDYRYFPEPDLPMLIIGQAWVKKIKSLLAELPIQKVEKFIAWGVDEKTSKILSSDDSKASLYIKASEQVKRDDRPKLATFFVNQGSKAISAVDLIEKFNLTYSQKASQIKNEQKLTIITQRILDENKKIVSDYKSGKVNAIQMLVGLVMKKTEGKADPKKTREILEKLLK